MKANAVCPHYRPWRTADPPLFTSECYWWFGGRCEHQEESMRDVQCPKPWIKRKEVQDVAP